jgi:uncharacterized damage-inducible protein DinB
MTLDTVILLARYNQHVNSEMNRLLSTLSENEWKKEFGGYYKSVHALCAHLYIGDSNWLSRFKTLRNFDSLNSPILAKLFTWGEKPFETFDEYEKKRIDLDELIISFVNEVKEDDLVKHLQYVNWKGVPQDRYFGGLLIHVFNHQTHHRGMISLYLELLGKENDFSNLLNLV